MADDSISRKTDVYYVYVLYRDIACMNPFYVGKGKGDRWNMHERSVRNRQKSINNNRHLTGIIKALLKTIGCVPREKIYRNLTEEMACSLEILLIRNLGREPIGPLVNLTDGGEGVSNPSPQTREKMRQAKLGKKQSPETILKRSLARLGVPFSGERRIRHRMMLLARNSSQDHINKVKLSLKGKIPSQATRDAALKFNTGSKHSEEHKQKNIQFLKASLC